MARPGRSRSWTPEVVDFLRTKYGRELLIDAGFVSGYADFERGGRPHVLDFHDILLVTRGRGRLALDSETLDVAPGVVVFTRPGEVRQWRLRAAVDGACVFFKADFVADAFADPRFLGQFAYFRSGRPSGALPLSRGQRQQFLRRFAVMQREIAALRDDATHALRAVLYDLLVLLNRSYVARYGDVPALPPNGLVERFEARVERDFRRRHGVADYARDLGVSPGHLNALCRARLRCSAGAHIRRRVTLEAQRLLAYSDLTAAQIADALGFDDPAYFARFFGREAGLAPTSYRAARQTPGRIQGTIERVG